MRALLADRQHRARDRRSVEQRVGGERQAARRHGADRVAGATRLRDAADERGARDRVRSSSSGTCSCSPTRARDPQAYVLRPDIVLELSAADRRRAEPLRTGAAGCPGDARGPRERVLAAGAEVGAARDEVAVSADRRRRRAARSEDELLAEMLARVELGKVRLDEYELAVGVLVMSPRERVAAALDHEAAGPPPFQATFTPEFAARLRAELSLAARERGAQPSRRRQHLRPRDRARRGHAADLGRLGELLLPGRRARLRRRVGRRLARRCRTRRPYGSRSLHRADRSTRSPTTPRSSSYRPPDPDRERAVRATPRRRSREFGDEYWIVGVDGDDDLRDGLGAAGTRALLMDFVARPGSGRAILDIPYRYHLAAAERLVAPGRRHDLARRRHRPADRHADLAQSTGGASSSRGMAELIATLKAINPELKIAYHTDGCVERDHPGADRDRRRRAQPDPAGGDGSGPAQARVRARAVLLGVDGRAAHAAVRHARRRPPRGARADRDARATVAA